MHIASIGIDLGKTTFHLVALGERSKVLVRKKFSRAQLLAYTANLPSSARAPRNKVIVAIANKLARIAWAIMTTGELFRSDAPIAPE